MARFKVPNKREAFAQWREAYHAAGDARIFLPGHNFAAGWYAKGARA